MTKQNRVEKLANQKINLCLNTKRVKNVNCERNYFNLKKIKFLKIFSKEIINVNSSKFQGREFFQLLNCRHLKKDLIKV